MRVHATYPSTFLTYLYVSRGRKFNFEFISLNPFFVPLSYYAFRIVERTDEGVRSPFVRRFPMCVTNFPSLLLHLLLLLLLLLRRRARSGIAYFPVWNRRDARARAESFTSQTLFCYYSLTQ